MVFDLVSNLLILFLQELVESFFDNAFQHITVLVLGTFRPVLVCVGIDVKPGVRVKISFGEILGIKSLRQCTDKVIYAS